MLGVADSSAAYVEGDVLLCWPSVDRNEIYIRDNLNRNRL